MTKSQQIKHSLQQTRKRRKSQSLVCFELKLTKNHLPKLILNQLHKLFLESKWFYNAFLSSNRTLSSKVTSVSVFNEHQEQEQRPLTVLSSQMKQALITKVKDSIHALHVLKSKGFKVGRLKFKKEINSVPLKQHGNTFTLFPTYIKVQNIKHKLPIRGYNQITIYCTKNNINLTDIEITTAKLIRRATDFFLHVTIAVPKTQKYKDTPNEAVGTDYGCATQLTLYNDVDAIKIEYTVPPNKSIRILHQNISRSIKVNGKNKRTKNRFKNQLKLRKEYFHQSNQRKDIANKVVHKINSNFQYVCYQDDNLHSWGKNHGKKISHTAIGRIKGDIKKKSLTPIEVDRYFPSTQLCPVCGVCTKHSVDKRTFVCSSCGYTADRDIKSAGCTLHEGLKRLGIKGLEQTSMENLSTALTKDLEKLGVKVRYFQGSRKLRDLSLGVVHNHKTF